MLAIAAVWELTIAAMIINKIRNITPSPEVINDNRISLMVCRRYECQKKGLLVLVSLSKIVDYNVSYLEIWVIFSS